MIEFTYKPDWPWLVTGGVVVAGALYLALVRRPGFCREAKRTGRH